ncbi:hypothetical protein J3F84DRAFT_392954 [Trichoderma pleuroticola]
MERTALANSKLWGDDGKLFIDWTSAAKTLQSGPKKAVVFSMIQQISVNAFSPYLYLSTVTGGHLFEIKHMVSDKISQLTIGVLLTWMRLGKADADSNTQLGYLTRYKSTTDILTATNEEDKLMEKYVARGNYGPTPTIRICSDNVETQPVTVGAVPGLIETRGPKVQSFTERYIRDPNYREMVLRQLKAIIKSNLITLFGLHVDKISDPDEKARMKAWLAESYDYADKINAMIEAVAPEDRFPMVFLDPTADFGFVEEDAEGEKQRLQDFTRSELLEIGRSCDYKILRRLGKVLTCLTFVGTKDELPHHIQTMDPQSAVPCIPLALAEGKYNCSFWEILLHAVLPGTKLGLRPACLLAALALRMGIVPLREAADRELLAFSVNWKTLDVPETWSLGCLNLLLDADKDYEKRVAEGVTTRPWKDARVLPGKDRDTFRVLVDYKMLELNLDTVLEAQITWTPEKTKVALGPLVVCKKCQFPRSVTIMAPGGVCGMCDIEGNGCSCSACSTGPDHRQRLKTNVAADQTESSEAYWVECGQTSCRAQYVVYNPNDLRVRPKCFFCRHTNQLSKKPKDENRRDVGKAPTVECFTCLGRIIWPEEYRPEDLDLSKYQCPACIAGKKTIVGEETTARKLSGENNWDWLLKNEDMAIEQPFNGRSVFYTASNCNLAALNYKVEILPASDDNSFTIRGKLVRNPDELRASLLHWVRSRRTEAATCSLCFSNMRKSDALPACGRSGCHQVICSTCRDSWYGINAPGRILNMPALNCPFCRRRPAPKAISKFRLHQIGQLRAALEESGSWIYAWCKECGFARQYVERVCAAGAPAELTDWICEECTPYLIEGKRRIRHCPGCGVVTEKAFGCDHITCPCGTHWCYACGKKSNETEIYTHMQEAHGGMYWGDD